MTTNVEAEELPESKGVTLQIKWRNVVLLTVIHLIALYAAADVVPRLRLNTFVWRRWRPVCLLHTYTSVYRFLLRH